MNGNTYFNLRFYNPLPVKRQQVAAANSEAQSLRESLGVRAAYISWIVRVFSPPILRTWVQRSTLLLQNRGHAEVLKRTPSSAKYENRCGPPLYLSAPPPPLPGHKPKMGVLITPRSSSFFLFSNKRGVSGIYESTVPPLGDMVRFLRETVKPTTPGLAW